MGFLYNCSNPDAGYDITINRSVTYVKSKLYLSFLNLYFFPDTNSLKKFILQIYILLL